MGSVQNLFVLFWRSVAKEDCVFWFDVLFKSDNPGNASLWYHARSGLLRSVLLLMDVRVVTIGLPSLSASKLVSNHAITLSTSLGGKLINYRLSKLGLNNVISNSMGFET